jgi:hypothetical protein
VRHPLLYILLSILLLPLVDPVAASVCAPYNPALFLTHEPQVCHADLIVDEMLSLEFGIFTEDISDPISEIRLHFDNWPQESGEPLGVIVSDWWADEVMGQPEETLTLGWTIPLDLSDPGYLQLGVVSLLPLSEAWIGQDHRMTLVSEFIDRNGQTIASRRSHFTFNCSEPDLCGCWPDEISPGWLQMRDLVPVNGSSVSGHFPLEFTISSFQCEGVGPIPYHGDLHLDGDLLFTFAGMGDEPHYFTINTDWIPPGQEVVVELMVKNSELQRNCRLGYFVEEGTATAGFSFSAIKSRY